MIGRNIKRVLERQGKTQRELAEAIGITEASMSRYIHGDRVPKATTLVKIANALGVSPDQLLSDKDNPIESSLTQKALDTISRQAAIDALDALCDRECEYSKKQRSVMCGACHLGSAFDVIEQLPSVQPERKKVKWIPLFDGMFTGGAYWFHCSKCERVVPDVRNGGWNFCPNCGADMREETDAV